MKNVNKLSLQQKTRKAFITLLSKSNDEESKAHRKRGVTLWVKMIFINKKKLDVVVRRGEGVKGMMNESCIFKDIHIVIFKNQFLHII